MKRILFVCTGNTCRSPMAEGIFNMTAHETGLDAKAASCGIYAPYLGPAADNAVKAAKEYGADISGHLSKIVDEPMLEAADVIYCMTLGHVDALCRLFPKYRDIIEMISENGIDDPFGGSYEEYLSTAGEIAVAIEKIVSGLKDENS